MSHDWPKEKGLPIHIIVYIPGTVGLSKRISTSEHKKRAKEVEGQLRKLFGGTTKIKGEGTWKDKDKVISEKVLMVESFTTQRLWVKNDKVLKRYLQRKKREWKQESLSYEWYDETRNLPFEGMNFL